MPGRRDFVRTVLFHTAFKHMVRAGVLIRFSGNQRRDHRTNEPRLRSLLRSPAGLPPRRRVRIVGKQPAPGSAVAAALQGAWGDQ